MTDDAENLVHRATQGDGIAVDELIARYLPGLEAYVRRHAGQLVQAKETPDDVVQSACREVLGHLDRFRYDGEDGFRQWLYATALRKIKDKHRYYLAAKRNARREVPMERGPDTEAGNWLELVYESFGSPSQHAQKQEEMGRLAEVFPRLPENYQTVIRRAYLEHRSHDEIAAELGITNAHARVLLSRALARLSTLLRSEAK